MPYVDADGACLYYEDYGEGPAVIFAHGAGGNLMSWFQQVPRFLSRHRVVLFDHRGFGRSTCDPDRVDIRDFADDPVRIADAAGVARMSVVCQSMGGWTGLGVALRHPDRVACLVLGATPGGIMTPQIAETFRVARSQASSGGAPSQLVLSEGFRLRAPELTLLYDFLSGLNQPIASILSQLADPARCVSPESLSKFRVPTLVLAGQHDPIFPPTALEDVTGLLPNAEFRVMADSGHSIYYERPDQFNDVVETFIARHI